MGIDEKVFVCCAESEALKVGQAVHAAIVEWLGGKLNDQVKKTGATSRFDFLNNYNKFKSFRYTSNVVSTSYGFESFSLTFGCGDGKDGEATRRRVFFTTNCHCDYREVYDGEKLIFSISKWGSSAEIMRVVAISLLPFGKVYYSSNGENFEEVLG